MSTRVPVTIVYGNGIGPEIMEASLHIIQEAGARIELEVIEIGENVYLRGNTAGKRGLKDQGMEIVKTETLRTYNGNAGYSLSQGQ